LYLTIRKNKWLEPQQHYPEFHDRSKHIEIRHHFLRQKIDENELDLVFVPTGDQVADVLTKGLVREKHERFADAMGTRRVG
jgi:hypothetical protein